MPLYHLTDVPEPPDSHYVGIIYLYQENDAPFLITIKDQDKFEGHINTKLPGGSNTRLYEEYVPYENYLFDILDRLKFEKKALIKILKNERLRKKTFEEYPTNQTMAFVLRTMVLQCLNKIGYYPFDLEPKVAHVVEKSGHIQYFIEVNHLIDAKGEEISAPDITSNFRALDSDIKATRVPMPLDAYTTLILSHSVPIEKYLLAKNIVIKKKDID